MRCRFVFKKNSDLHLNVMQIPFFVKKNSDLHLRKMYICFLISRKIIDHMQIMGTKKEIITIRKEIKNMF